MSPSSAAEFHFREMEYGTTSVMENSLTLNAGDKIAHWERENEMNRSDFKGLIKMVTSA